MVSYFVISLLLEPLHFGQGSLHSQCGQEEGWQWPITPLMQVSTWACQFCLKEKVSKSILTEKRIKSHDMTVAGDVWWWKCGTQMKRLDRTTKCLSFLDPQLRNWNPSSCSFDNRCIMMQGDSMPQQKPQFFLPVWRRNGGRTEKGRWTWTNNVRYTRMKTKKKEEKGLRCVCCHKNAHVLPGGGKGKLKPHIKNESLLVLLFCFFFLFFFFFFFQCLHVWHQQIRRRH